MKKHIVFAVSFMLLAMPPCGALALEELWDKYYPVQESDGVQKAAPGRLLGNSTDERRRAFADAWRYRHVTYELHYEDPVMLARMVYGIALHAGDIDRSLDRKLFLGGVLGYHYSLQQVYDWLNAVVEGSFAQPDFDEMRLVGMLLQDGALEFRDGRFNSTGKVSHVLGAAPGTKRTFADNVRHERLHVFWDEDASFREQSLSRWQGLSVEKSDAAKKALARYASDNEQQLVEEWAVHQAESSNMSIE